MTNVLLENERLKIQINESGSELVRIFDKEKEREVLWDANPGIWARYAPILFPFIGNCFEGKYSHKGTVYSMTPHGFARDSIFDLKSLSEHQVSFQLNDNEKTCEIYPFHFNLEVTHKLEGNRIHNIWSVTNQGEEPMLFMLGGHPAFRVPEGKTIYDFTFRFDQKDRLHYEAPNDNGYADSDKQGILELKDGKVPLTEGFFEEALTYIFDQGQIGEVSLLLPGDEPYITLHCRDVPYLGVWTKESTNPFVCLEPWFGRCADDGFTGELRDRAGVISLAAGKTFAAGYVIEIH